MFQHNLSPQFLARHKVASKTPKPGQYIISYSERPMTKTERELIRQAQNKTPKQDDKQND